MTLIVCEIVGFIQAPLVWYLYKRYAGRNMAGEMIASAIVGVVWEIATEPLWDYNFVVTYYRDCPVAGLTGWMIMFPTVVYFSERFYCAVLKKDKLLSHDRRIFIFDVITAALVCLPLETAGAKLGVWTYRQDLLKWDWGFIPFFNMPWEIIFGYSLLMLIAPTFVRYWEKDFE